MNFLQGTLDLLILRALAERQRHGYDIVAWLRDATRGELEIEDGALYTALHRMEARGWLAAQWRTSPKGRRAKYYLLTADGHRELKRGERGWTRFTVAVSNVFHRGEA